MIRHSAVSGSFYPKACHDIEAMIAEFNAHVDKHLDDTALPEKIPRAIIVPHAGYIYSGFTANMAYRLLQNAPTKRVIVIGPSHYVGIEGISAIAAEYFETPCGNLRYDAAYLQRLQSVCSIGYVPLAHQKEHSTETQMPFIQHYLPHSSVIELIYGHEGHEALATLCCAILEDDDNVLVISTDLSHFYTQHDAHTLDSICLEAIVNRDNTIIEKGCEACGIIGVKAMLEVAQSLNYYVKLLDYRTSADASGDTSRVVGYVSAAFFQ